MGVVLPPLKTAQETLVSAHNINDSERAIAIHNCGREYYCTVLTAPHQYMKKNTPQVTFIRGVCQVRQRNPAATFRHSFIA